MQTCDVATLREIPAMEKNNQSCVVLRLTLLAPEIVEAILDGRQVTEMTLPGLMKAFPEGWDRQRTTLIGRGVTGNLRTPVRVVRCPRLHC